MRKAVFLLAVLLSFGLLFCGCGSEQFSEELEYKIVGSTEANSLKGKISNESPVGKALIGHKVGDTVEVETPAGVFAYKILEIQRSNVE